MGWTSGARGVLLGGLAWVTAGCGGPLALFASAPLAPDEVAVLPTTTTTTVVQQRLLANWNDPQCPARPSSTTWVKLNSCLAETDHGDVLSCLEADELTIRCGLRAEAYLQHTTIDTDCNKPREPERTLWTAARRLLCSLDEEHNGGSEAARVREVRSAATEFWAEIRKQRQRAPLAYSLVARGGVSLGNWQAGVLLYLSEVLKLRRRRLGTPSFTTVTGASAGAINAMASAVASCEKRLRRPQDSLYYQTWINLGLFGRHGQPGLLPSDDGASRLGVFSDDVLTQTMASSLRAIQDPRRFVALPGVPCRVRFGLTVTYLEERSAAVHLDADNRALIKAPRIKERFALDLQWRARRRAGAPPTRKSRGATLQVANLWPRRRAQGARTVADRQFYALLGHPKTRRDPVNPRDVLRAVRASGAFPVAFPPVRLEHTAVTPQGAIGKHDRSLFVDGGTMDNTPIGLAIKLDEWDAQRDPNPYFEYATEGPRRAYLFVDANATTWHAPQHKPGSQKDEEINVISRYLDFGGTLMGASLQASLVDTVERWPFIQKADGCDGDRCLLVPTRNLPITGVLLGHFMAFLERDFRIYDFYAGMADGAHFVQQDSALSHELLAWAQQHGLARHTTAAEQFKLRSEKLTCMLDYSHARRDKRIHPLRRMQYTQLPASCRSLGYAPWQALGLQREAAIAQALEQIGSVQYTPHNNTQQRHAEAYLGAHNFRALIVAMHNFHAWERSPKYSRAKETNRFFAELQQQNYRYTDIPPDFGSIDTPADARVVLRRIIHQGTEALANQQPSQASRAAVRTVSRFGGDMVAGPIQARATLRVGIASLGLDTHAGWRPWRAPLRPELGLRVFRIAPRNVFPDQPQEWLVDVTGYARVVVPLTPDGLPWLTLEPGVGVVLSETITGNDGHGVLRAGWQNSLTAVFGQRFWVEVDFEHFLDPIHVSKPWAAPGVAELISPDSRLNGAAGWQFFW